MLRKLLVLSILISPLRAVASAEGGNIVLLQCGSNGACFVQGSGTRTGSIPTCGSPTAAYGFWATSTGGYNMLLKLANLLEVGASVSLIGSGGCSVESNTEDLFFVEGH